MAISTDRLIVMTIIGALLWIALYRICKHLSSKEFKTQIQRDAALGATVIIYIVMLFIVFMTVLFWGIQLKTLLRR